MKAQQNYQDAVTKTVLFWSDKSFKTNFNQNNGDNSSQGGLVFALMNTVSGNAQNDLTDDKIKKFEDKLTELLIAKEDGSPYSRTLDVDYHPCRELAEACSHAEIDASCLPCKTTTWISDSNEATASYQYGGKMQVL